MAKYIVNVELENAAETDYTVLSSELSKLLFKNENHATREIPYVAGNRIFTRQSEIGLQDVSRDVTRAASSTGKKFSFFITRQKTN